MDLRHLREHGYVVVEQAIEPHHVRALLGLLRDEAGLDVDDPATWDFGNFSPPIWNHQAQWDVRQHPPVYEAFAAAWGEEKLVTALDGMGFKPPVDVAATRAAAALPLHWDRDPRHPPQAYSGVLYLTDVEAHGGAFCGVPGIFREIDDWLRRHPDQGIGSFDREHHELVAVPGRAGDLVLFDSRLPHGNAENRAERPRAVQYVAYWPPGFWGDTPQDTAELYRTGIANPAFRERPGWDVPNPWPPAELSPLGRRLAGLEPW